MDTDLATRPAGTAPPAASIRPLVVFAGIALPVGWVLLSIPLVTGLPLAPFILGTLYLGLVLPAVVLTRRDPRASLRELLRDTVRLPRPAWLLLPAALLLPLLAAAAGAIAGRGAELSGSFVLNLAVADIASSLLVINLGEEMAWAGFVQRRAAARWGLTGGAVATALLFTGIHLPLSLYGAHDAGDVAFTIGAMLASGVGMRLLIGTFDVWGRGSILVAGLLHATFNAAGELLAAGTDLIRYAVTLGAGLAALALYAATTRRGAHR